MATFKSSTPQKQSDEDCEANQRCQGGEDRKAVEQAASSSVWAQRGADEECCSGADKSKDLGGSTPHRIEFCELVCNRAATFITSFRVEAHLVVPRESRTPR